jgi:predicted nucleic acid-binding Zn ribbon protein
VAIGEDHRHCKICGKVCAPAQETCSKAHRLQLEERQRSRQNSVRLMYLLIAVVVIVFVVGYFR